MDMLTLIEVRPIQRPVYCSANIRDYAKWAEDNQQLLVDYFNLLITTDGAGPTGEDDLFIFTLCQWDFERDRMEELGHAYGDPTPWCSYGHRSESNCDCGPIADKD